MTNVLLTAALLLASLSINAQQDTIYMDSAMKHLKKKNKATHYAIVQGTQNNKTQVDLYTIDGKLIKSSEYKTFGNKENKQVLEGLTTYKYENSNQDSLKVFYKGNIKNGDAVYYHPNGKVKVNCQYKNGQLHGLLHQYYEDGKTTRKEVYKDDRSEGGIYLSPDSLELPYSPFYQIAQFNEAEIVSIIAKNVTPNKELLNDMCSKKIERVSAKIGINIDEKGKITDLIIIESDNKHYNKKCLDQALSELKNQTVSPAQIDAQPIASTFIIKSPILFFSVPSPSTINFIK